MEKKRGIERDGTIELRPGCEDLNLGRAHYAQVRIGVDGEHFMKRNGSLQKRYS